MFSRARAWYELVGRVAGHFVGEGYALKMDRRTWGTRGFHKVPTPFTKAFR